MLEKRLHHDVDPPLLVRREVKRSIEGQGVCWQPVDVECPDRARGIF